MPTKVISASAPAPITKTFDNYLSENYLIIKL